MLCTPTNVTYIGNHWRTFVGLQAFSLLNSISSSSVFTCLQNLTCSSVINVTYGIHTSGVPQFVWKVLAITNGGNPVSWKQTVWGLESTISSIFPLNNPIGPHYTGNPSLFQFCVPVWYPFYAPKQTLHDIDNHFRTSAGLQAFSLLNPVTLFSLFTCPQNLTCS